MVFNNNLLLGAAGQGGAVPFDTTLIGNSVWLDGTADYFSRSYSGSGNSTTEAIFAFWYQRYSFGVAQSTWFEASGFGGLQTNTGYGGGDTLVVNTFDAGGTQVIARHTRLLRDVAWYHIIVSIDMSQATTLDKIKFYINGEQDTTINVQNLATTNGLDMLGARSKVNFRIGENAGSTGHAYAQYCYLDGVSIQQGDYAVTDFLDTYTLGTNGSQYIPKVNTDISALATAAGGNSICLDFADSSDLGNDISSNNNDFTPNSISSANQSISTPSKTYSVFNPIAKRSSAFTLSNGNRTTVTPTFDQWMKTTIPFVMSGSNIIRTQFTFSTVGDGLCGITGSPHTSGTYYTSTAAGRGEVALLGNGALVIDGSFNNTYTSALSNGDIVDVIVNLDVGAVYFAVNGSLLGGATQSEIQAGTTTNAAQVGSFVRRVAGEVFNYYVGQYNPSAATIDYNSGQTAFTHSYSSITSLKSLNTADLLAPDYQGIDYFDSTLYEGNGTGQRVGDFVPFTDAYTVDNSAMFENADKRYLSFTPSAGGDQKTFTFSTWFKLSNPNIRNTFLSTDDGSKEAQINHVGDGGKHLNVYFYNGSSFVCNLNTSRVFADTSQWYHLVVAVDTRAAVASANKVKIYINGVQETTTGTALSTDDYETEFNSENAHNIGRQTNNGIGEPSWYLAETVMVEGSQLDPTSFGQVDTSTNRWIPKDVSGLTFGDEGWYLEYEGTFNSGVAATGAGKDSSGNGNHWAEQNDSGSAWSTSDQFTDTPSKNYAIFSPKNIGSATATLSEGNLKYTGANNGGFPITIQPTSGKWYFEVELDTLGAYYPGLFTAAGLSYTGASAWAQTSAFVYLTNNASGAVYNGGTVVNGYNTGSMSASDRLGIAWDVDNNFIYYGLASGGSTTFFSSGDPTSGAVGTGAAPFTLPNERLYFGVVSGGAPVSTHHFISSGWIGAAPTGFSELNQDNLDDTASKITAWAWIKNRDSTDSHILVDRVRGVGEVLHSNEAAAEATEPNTVQRFLQRGVQVGSDVQVNTANESYVLWQWLMGDSATTGTVNNDGSIASTLIAADAGHFSVGTYTGQTAAGTVGHGLGGAAEMVIVWDKGFANSIAVYHAGVASDAATDYLLLNQPDAATDNATFWNDTAPTSSVFSVGTGNNTNGNTRPKSFLAFRSVPGVCKVGSYVGNSNDDGSYLSLGFKPAWWMVKETTITDASHNWFVSDSARYVFNGTTTAGGSNGGTLEADNSTAEEAHNTNFTDNPAFDFLADGIKLRTNSGTINATGRTYVYIAMADLGGNGTLPPIYGR